MIGLAAALFGPTISWLVRNLHSYAERWTMIVVPLAGVAVAALAIIHAEATGRGTSEVLFPGRTT